MSLILHIGFWWEAQKGSDQQGDPSRKWMAIISMGLREIGWGGMDWIDLARDRDQLRAFLNTVMKLKVV
jgi:hypothetical protein